MKMFRVSQLKKKDKNAYLDATREMDILKKY